MQGAFGWELGPKGGHATHSESTSSQGRAQAGAARCAMDGADLVRRAHRAHRPYRGQAGDGLVINSG